MKRATDVDLNDPENLGIWHRDVQQYIFTPSDTERLKGKELKYRIALSETFFPLHTFEFWSTEVPSLEKRQHMYEVAFYPKWKEFLRSQIPDEYAIGAARVDRILSKDQREPLHVSDGVEFLEFRDADPWAGPHVHDGRRGCHMMVRENSPDKAKAAFQPYYPDRDFYSYQTNGMSPEEKSKYFWSQPASVQVRLARWRKYRHLSVAPYVLYLYGNDDTSYSKGFDTKEEMDAERQYLRRVQPLDFHQDILLRGYEFTN